jgi:two-component system cell cycle response regulator
MDNPKQRPRILIVDESRMARATLIKQVRECYDFREEVNGEAGWQALVLDHSIQLVICALSMPMLDGDGLLARIRASRLARLRQMPVLMIAGDNEEASACPGTRGLRLHPQGNWRHRTARSHRFATALVQAQNNLRGSPGLPSGYRTADSPARRHAGDAGPLVCAAARSTGKPAGDGLRPLRRAAREHGDELVKELQKRFVSMLAQKVRKEDCLGHYSDSELAVSRWVPLPCLRGLRQSPARSLRGRQDCRARASPRAIDQHWRRQYPGRSGSLRSVAAQPRR